ncbi:190_t:CDS:2, partial [Cetraspora pellucida]
CANSFQESYLPSTEELDQITNSRVPVNIMKSIEKWVNILKNWYKKVGYNYDIETITDKSQLEREMQEFIVGNTLDGKMKQLKRNGIIPQHHDPLTEEETSFIFNHPNVSALHAQELQYRVFIWMCMLCALQGGEHSQMKISQFKFLSDGVIIFTKWSQKNDQEGLDDNGHTTSITHLYQLEMPNSTLMSITGHKSESSVRIYSHSSAQQKKDCLSTIINSSISNIKNNSNIQTIEPNNQDNEDQTIELNNQDNKDLNKQNIQIIKQSNQDATNLINHAFQTHAPLSNIQINSIPPTDPGIY